MLAISVVGMIASTLMLVLLSCLTTPTHGVETSKEANVRRENGLDHWDSDTLAYYLDNYPGYDLAVMFYARWDTNSQRLAPYWNQIAHILDAGNSQSKLIMVRTIVILVYVIIQTA